MMIITLQRPLSDEACVCFELSRTMVRTLVGRLHHLSTPVLRRITTSLKLHTTLAPESSSALVPKPFPRREFAGHGMQ